MFCGTYPMGTYTFPRWEHTHFHPSGDVLPSKDDKEMASTLQQIADLLGVALADFCIVGDSFYSFRKNELL